MNKNCTQTGYGNLFHINSDFNIENGTATFENNNGTGDSINFLEVTSLNINTGAKLIINNNKIKRSNYDQRMLLLNSSAKILGDLTITNNKITQSSGTSTRKTMALTALANTVTVGSGSIVIRNNDVYTDEEGTVKNTEQHVYPLYSTITDNSTALFEMETGCKFSKDTYIEGIAFSRADGLGYILKNWDTLAEDVESFKHNIFADRYDNELLLAAIKDGDLIINIFNTVDFVVMDGDREIVVATQSVLRNYYIKKASTPSDVTGLGRLFMGWSLDKYGDEDSIIDIYSLLINDNKKLYAVFRSHIHKLCGVSSTSACTHDGNTHTTSVNWMSLLKEVKDEDINDYLNGTKGGLGQYICLQKNITLTSEQITLTRDINICLNGYSITGNFKESEHKVLITNCQDTVSKIGNTDMEMFNNVNFDIYGIDKSGVKNINIVGGRYIVIDTTSSKQVYIYNATFVKKKTTAANDDEAIYVGNAEGRKEITFDNVNVESTSITDSQYTNIIFVATDGSRENTIINFKNLNISGYTSYVNRLMYFSNATVNFYGTNTISNNTGSNTEINNRVLAAFQSNVKIVDGKLLISDNKIIGGEVVLINDSSEFLINENAELEISNNKINKDSYQGIINLHGKMDILGKLSIVNNKIVNAVGESLDIAAGILKWERSTITVENNPIIINNNNVYEDEEGTIINHEQTVFAIWSFDMDFDTPIFTQQEGTKFSKDSIIDGIGFEGDRAFGYIIKNWNEATAEDYEGYNNNFKINTFRNEGKNLSINKYKGGIVIACFYNIEFMYDETTYVPTISTQSVFVNEYIEKVASPSHPSGKSKYFLGWATKSDATKDEVIDIYANPINADIKLYTVYEEHKHKICGLDIGSVCNHTGIDDHTEDIDFEVLTNEFISKNGFPKSGNYYLHEDITLRAFVQVNNTLNLCLNGFELKEVRFSSDNNSTINITNCDDDATSIKALANPEASTTQETYALFNTMNVNVIAAKGAIDINADHIINTEYVSVKQDQTFYNVNFKNVTSNITRGAVFKVSYTANVNSTLRIVESSISDYNILGNSLFDTQNVITEFENTTITDNTTNNSLFNNAGTVEFLYTTIEGNNVALDFIRSANANSVINILDGNEFNDNIVGGHFIYALNGITFDGSSNISRNTFNNNNEAKPFIWSNASEPIEFLNGNTIISYNTDGATSNSPYSFVYTENDLRIVNSAKVIIRNNRLKNSTANYSIIYNANSSNLITLDNSGSLEIFDNEVQQNAANDNIKAAILVSKNKKINISSGSIIINGNIMTGTESGNTHMFGIYSEETNNTTAIFNQTANKFNKNSFINSIGFAEKDGFGRIIDNWTELTAEDVESYKDIFIGDSYGKPGRNLVAVYDEEYKFVALSERYIVNFLYNDGSDIGIASQSIIRGKVIVPVATPSDPTGREREFMGWATKSDATLDEIIETMTYEIYEDTNFYTVFQLFEEHIHKICGTESGADCKHDGLASHGDAVEYEALTSIYIRRHGFPTSGNFFLFENLTITTEVTISNTLNLCLNGKTLNFVKFTSSDRQKVNIANCQDENGVVNTEAGEILFDNVVPSILSVKGTIDVYADQVVAFENATSVDRIEIFNTSFRPVSSSVTGNIVFGTSYSTENGSRVFIASSSISNYNLTSGSLILNHNNTWLAQKLYIYNNNISAHMLNNEGSFTMTEVIASANIIHLNAIQNNVTGASITYRSGTVFANNKFYRQYLYNSREITYNGDISFINNEYNIGSDDYAFMHSNYTSATTFINGTVLFDGNKDMTTNNRASSGFLYFEAGVNVYNSTKIIIRNNKFVKTTGSQSIFTIQSGGSFLTLTGTAQIRIEDNEYRQDINTDSLVTAFYVRAGQQITMANSSFYIKNNRITGSYSDRNHMYGLYSGALNESTPIFVQSSGNFSDENYIDSVAFGTESGFGVITENYAGTEDPVELAKRIVADPYKRHSLKTIIDGNRLIIGDAFNAEFKYEDDTYIPTIPTQSVIAGEFIESVATPSDPKGKGRKFLGWATKSDANPKDLIEITTYVLTEDTVFYAIFETHMHTICGVSTTSCTHTLLPEIHDIVAWNEIVENATIDEFKSAMEVNKEKNLCLTSDIGDEAGSEYVTITLTADTYLCLNGHSIHNIRFNQSNYKLVITNCKPVVSHITRNTDDGVLFNSNDVDIYGRDNNINVKGFNVYNNTQNVEKAFNAYSVSFTQFDNSIEANQVFTTSTDNASQLVSMKFEDVEIYNFNATALFGRALELTLKNSRINGNKVERSLFDITSNGQDIVFEANNDIYDNESIGGSRALIDTAKNIIIEKLATLNVYNNKIERTYQDQKFLEFKNGDKILGSLNVTENKFVSAVGASNNILAAAYVLSGATVTVGSGSIVIKDNDVYTDADGTTKNYSQKVYQLYSASDDDTTPIFTQSAGTKFATSSYIDGIGFAHTEGFGHIIDNWTAETTDNVEAYKNIFIAETFRKEANKLDTILINNNVIINAVFKVEFMYDDYTYVPGLSTQSILKNKHITAVASPSDPTGAGRIFIGWATKSNANKEDVIDFSSFAVTKDIKLYATFVKRPLNPGEDIFFGIYPQSSDEEYVYDPLRWKVVDVVGNSALLVAEKIIGNEQYNSVDEATTWESSSIRTWLNNTFYNYPNSFTDDEKDVIENRLGDKFFLLSIEEARDMFENDEARKAEKTRRVSLAENRYYLRSVGSGDNRAAAVNADGSINVVGGIVTDTSYGTRPAFYADLASKLLNATYSNITWDLTGRNLIDDSNWLDMTTYREGFVTKLPTADNFTDGSNFKGWQINDSDEFYKEIPETITGDITLKAFFGFRVEFMYDESTYIPTIATQNVLVNEYVKAVATPSDPKGKGRNFIGWATKSNATKDDVIKIDEYQITEDTIFFAVFSSHNHKICGIGTMSCTHTVVDGTHTVVEWYPIGKNITIAEFKSKLETDDIKYLYLESDIGIEGSSNYESIAIGGDTYICLNGHSIHNVRFNTTTYNLTITNCQETISGITRNTDDATIFNSNNVDIFGVNKNIAIKGYNIYTNSVTETKTFNAYDVTFTQYNTNVDANQVFATSVDNASQLTSMKFEKVNLSGFSGNALFSRALGITLKNVNIYDSKFERTIFDIGANGQDIILDGNVDIYANETLGGNRALINTTKNILVERTATLSVINNKIERTYQDQKFLEFKNGDKILGKLVVTNNKYVSATGSSNNISSAVYVINGSSVTVGTGSIVIKDNDVYTDVAGTIKNTVQKVHQLYSATDDGNSPIFIQEIGSKFNSSSLIAGIGFAHVEGYGHIINNWTTETAEDVEAYKNIFITETFRKERNDLRTLLYENNVIINAVYDVEFMFDEDVRVQEIATQSVLKYKYVTTVASPSDPTGAGRTFLGWATKSDADRKDVINIYQYPIKSNTKFYTVYESHIHTICGVASGSCTHSLDTDVHRAVMWSGVEEGIGTSEFKTLLEEPREKYVYLNSNIGVEGGSDYKSVVLTADTYICLNGFSIHNIRFNQTAYKLVITNCQNTTSTLTRDTDDGNMFTSNNVDLYGVNKNVLVKGYNIYNNTTNANRSFNAYDVRFIQYDSSIQGNQVFSTSADSAAQFTSMKLEKVDISGFNGMVVFNRALGLSIKDITISNNKMERTVFDISTNGSDIIFAGNNNIDNNEIAETGKAIVGTSKNIIVEKVATLSVTHNKIKRDTQAQKFLELKNGDKILGSLIVKNNKFVSATGTNENIASAIYMAQGQTVVVGSGSIVISDNDVYTDESGNTKNSQQHVYQLYSATTDNSTAIFTQENNTKFKASSYIAGISFNHTDGYGHIIDNWTYATAENKNKFDSIFKADNYRIESKRPMVALEENNVIITSSYYVEFFLSEGVYASDVATQSVVRNGKVKPATPSLIVGAEKFLGWATSVDETQYWDYENDRVTADTKLYAKFLMGETHLHKVCGISSTSTCLTHTESDFGDHTSNIFYESVTKSDMVDIISSIAAESEVSIYLVEDIISDTPVVVYLGNATNGTRANPAEAVINICLNGHILKGYTFVTRNKNININITNCQDKLSTITNTSSDAFAKGGTYTYTQVTNTYTSSSRVDLRLFGNKDKNLKLVSDKIVGFSSATTTRYSTFASDNVVFTEYSNANNKLLLDKLNADPYIYNSVFDKFTNVDNIMTRNSGNATYKLKDSVFSNISATNTLFENTTLDISGEVVIGTVSAARNILSANINVNKAATLSIINNKLTRNTLGNAFINMTNETSMNILGSLVIKDNKIVGCTAANNSGIIAAINMNNKTMVVGDAPIVVKNNTSDGNASTYANHHMYGIYSALQDDNTAIMAQTANTKHSKNTYVDSIAFARANGFGHIINNWTRDTAEDINSYKTSFIADKFVHNYLITSVYKNNLVIGNYTEYKVYFISTISEVQKNLATQSIVNRGTASEPDVIKVSGYEFKGWYKDSAYTEKFDFENTLITEDTAVYVKYEKAGPETFKVVFVSTVSDAAIEAAIATQNIVYRGTASEPRVSYEGYDFIGWFTDTTYTTRFDFINTLITQDTTIYAKWVNNK